MSDQWHFTRDGQARGPVTWDQLQKLANAGQLTADDLIWTEGMGIWLEAGKIPELMSPTPAPQTITTQRTLRHRAPKQPAKPTPEPEAGEKLTGLDVLVIFFFAPAGIIVGLITFFVGGKKKSLKVACFSALALAFVAIGRYVLLTSLHMNN